MERQIVVDVWEGNPDLDVTILKQNGVSGIVIRLNDINGGHHKDEQFDRLWYLCSCLERSIYFVFSPWKTGIQNYEWIMNNIPAGYTGRIFVDVEVSYSGIVPKTYYEQLLVMLHKLRNPWTIYTGAGYLDMLSEWPLGDYWWAQYLFTIQKEPFKTTWEEYNERVNSTAVYPTNSKLCTGRITMWQVADHLVLPGFESHTIDLNVFYGSKQDLKYYFGDTGVIEMPTNKYMNNAKLIQLKDTVTVNENLVNGFDGIIADGGEGSVPAANFYKWVQIAADKNVPCIMKFKLLPDGGNEYNMGSLETGFPYPKDDTQIKALMRSLGSPRKKVHAIMLDMTAYTVNGKNITEGNYANFIEFMWSGVKTMLGSIQLPMYIFFTQETLSEFPSRPGLDIKLTSIGRLASWKSAMPTGAVSMQSWSNIPYPPDTYTPQSIEDPSFMFFSRYSNTLYTFPGITDAKGAPVAVPLWMYKGTREEMNKELNFVSTGPVPEPPVVGAISAADIKLMSDYTKTIKSNNVTIQSLMASNTALVDKITAILTASNVK